MERFLLGDWRGIERRGVDLRVLAPESVPPLLNAAMSWVASSSELMFAAEGLRCDVRGTCTIGDRSVCNSWGAHDHERSEKHVD